MKQDNTPATTLSAENNHLALFYIQVERLRFSMSQRSLAVRLTLRMAEPSPSSRRIVRPLTESSGAMMSVCVSKLKC